MRRPLVFAPVTRWVLAWPDGQTLRRHALNGRDCGPELFTTRTCAIAVAQESFLDAGWRPVKVRVTIEVAK